MALESSNQLICKNFFNTSYFEVITLDMDIKTN